MEGNQFCPGFQLSSTAHYENLVYRKHTLCAIQHLWTPSYSYHNDWEENPFSLVLFSYHSIKILQPSAALTALSSEMLNFFSRAPLQKEERKTASDILLGKEYCWEQRLKLKTWNCLAEVWLLKPDIVESPRFYFGKYSFLNSNRS